MKLIKPISCTKRTTVRLDKGFNCTTGPLTETFEIEGEPPVALTVIERSITNEQKIVDGTVYIVDAPEGVKVHHYNIQKGVYRKNDISRNTVWAIYKGESEAVSGKTVEELFATESEPDAS